ncbi:hypothetical protein JM80_2919 [Cellulophaga sp. RHA_52]|uniref:DUF6134 family protein n=1 Tax=Cellulophaga sp. RHA_52 TaxID=1250036 RepID=UPI00119BF8F5|nr:DUF6134 family protein [Cellulophaga sp. RHA_52]TVZ10381.1 hypothetical protein JM80_2919 [Cellulophaga sp. RHA_52]
MIKNILLLVFLGGLIAKNNTVNTVLHFDILHKNKVVGNLQATKTIEDGLTTYHSFTHIQAKILTTINVKYTYNVVFNNKELNKADVSIMLNNKVYAETSTERSNKEYKITKNKKVSTFKEPITFTTVQLYFTEPLHITTCYSEQDAAMNTLIYLGNHKYKKVNAKDNENIYTYKNGVLYEASIDGGLINFTMKIKD